MVFLIIPSFDFLFFSPLEYNIIVVVDFPFYFALLWIYQIKFDPIENGVFCVVKNDHKSGI